MSWFWIITSLGYVHVGAWVKRRLYFDNLSSIIWNGSYLYRFGWWYHFIPFYLLVCGGGCIEAVLISNLMWWWANDFLFGSIHWFCQPYSLTLKMVPSAPKWSFQLRIQGLIVRVWQVDGGHAGKISRSEHFLWANDFFYSIFCVRSLKKFFLKKN